MVILCRFWGDEELRDRPSQPPSNELVQRIKENIRERVNQVDPAEWPDTEALIDEIIQQVVDYSPFPIRWVRSAGRGNTSDVSGGGTATSPLAELAVRNSEFNAECGCRMRGSPVAWRLWRAGTSVSVMEETVLPKDLNKPVYAKSETDSQRSANLTIRGWSSGGFSAATSP